MDKTEKLLQELTNAPGIPGYEWDVRKIARRMMKPLGSILEDKTGSVICRKRGSADGPRVMLSGHADEVGFMVKHITKDGFLRFTALGGWWDQVLLGQRVTVKTHKGDLTGVIGAKPIHLLDADERGKLVKKNAMYVDIGATSIDEVEKAGVRVGDPMIPVSEFAVLASGKTYMGKAFDDRVGCALTIMALEHFQDHKHPNTIFGTVSVQEEVGLRGATTAAEVVDPDVCLALDVGIAGDVPGISPEESPAKLGGGPVIFLYDTGMIPNLKLRDLAIDLARKNKIPLQQVSLEAGTTDGHAIHIHKAGVPTLVLGVPVRHIHSHNGIFHRHDLDGAAKLMNLLIASFDKKTVAGLTEF